MRALRLLVAVPVFAGAAAVLTAVAALANDLWLSPTAFRPKAGDEVSIRLMVGPNLDGKSRPRDDARIDTFLVRGWDGAELPAEGKTGDDPAGKFRVPEDGTWVVGFRSKPANVTLEPAKFERYLKDNGLDEIVAERERLGESKEKGRETFSRCAKAMLSCGKGEPGGHDRSLGLRFEVFPEKNPYRAKAGDEIPFRLVLDGKPLEGALVRARSVAKPREPVEARTDAEGRVKLRLPDAGMWFVGCVRMFRSDPEKTFTEWESIWTSLTFDLAAAEPAAEKPAAPAPAGVPGGK